jgi:hypothetical protein
MRTLLLLLLVALTNIGFAQEKYIDYTHGNNKYHQFEVGTASYLLADNVNVRSNPSSKGDVVTNLPIGTAIKIVEMSDKKLRLNGFETNWYKVSFKANNSVATGYVWGGLIAEGSIKGTNSKVQFLYGIASVKKEKNENNEAYAFDGITIQVRACENQKELSKLEFKAAGHYLGISHWLGNYGKKGLENVEDVIEFGESEEMCGGTNGYNFIFWDGKKLLYVTTLYPEGDGGYYRSDNLIFPSDKGGEKGKLIKEQIEGSYDEEKEEDIIASHKKVEYVWTGKKLKQTKVLLDKKYEVKK